MTGGDDVCNNVAASRSPELVRVTRGYSYIGNRPLGASVGMYG